MQNEWLEKCEKAVENWSVNSGDTIMFHPVNFEDALFIREYMETNYSNINIFIIVKGFIYGTEIKNRGD